MNYPWYQAIDDSDLQQGDIIDGCPIVIPPPSVDINDYEIDLKLIDSIILTQSCDLVNGKSEIVLVCPYYKLDPFLSKQNLTSKGKRKSKIDELLKGRLPSYHLLNKDKENEIEDYLVVDFRNVYGVKINVLQDIARKLKKRKRLLPPYREHLSQAFARYFMRVGLPQDIKVEDY